jgi:transcriptional repressor NrdR
MRCPFCSAEKESLQVIDSRTCDNGKSIRRRRKCAKCGKRFTTYERIEQTTRLMVVKKDGRRVPWDKEKVLTGLERACFKRPVPEEEIHRVADEVEEEVRAAYDREVPSTEIGAIVIDKLRRLDQVAYVRFASVYREFKTIDDLVAVAQAVIDSRRYDDVQGQGKLFVEPPAPPAVNGHSAANGSAPEVTPVRRPRRPRRQPEQIEPELGSSPELRPPAADE